MCRSQVVANGFDILVALISYGFRGNGFGPCSQWRKSVEVVCGDSPFMGQETAIVMGPPNNGKSYAEHNLRLAILVVHLMVPEIIPAHPAMPYDNMIRQTGNMRWRR